MNFISFKAIIKDEVENKLGDSYTVRLNDVIKNNGIMLTGLTIVRDDSNISPTIYLNSYYEAYESGQLSFGEIVNDILGVYERNKVNRSIDMQYFLNYEEIRHRIIYKLINTEKNKELLQNIPHVEFHDLSIVFQFLVSGESFGSATILIQNVHLKTWNVSLDEIYADARHNTPILNKYEIKNMGDVIRELMPIAAEKGPVPIFVLSNKSRIQGAACMLYPDLLKDFSGTIDSSLYIIPSSVHEVLLLPTEDKNDADSIKRMVKEVNDTQVEAEEVLSYSVYYYDGIKNELSVL